MAAIATLCPVSSSTYLVILIHTIINGIDKLASSLGLVPVFLPFYVTYPEARIITPVRVFRSRYVGTCPVSTLPKIGALLEDGRVVTVRTCRDCVTGALFRVSFLGILGHFLEIGLVFQIVVA